MGGYGWFLFSFFFFLIFFLVGEEPQLRLQKGTSKTMQSPPSISDKENHLIHCSLLFSAEDTLIIKLILRALCCTPNAFQNAVSGIANCNHKMLLNGLIEFYPAGKFCQIFVLPVLGKDNLPWGSEGWFIKSELSAEVLSKSDSDLFGFVTIKVSGDRYLFCGILDKLAKWSGQSRRRVVFFDPSHGQRTGNYSPNHKHAPKSCCYLDFSPHPESGDLSLDKDWALYLISLKDTSEMKVWSVAVGIGR